MKKIIICIAVVFMILFFSCEKPERVALVQTGQVTEITATQATAAGEIINPGEGITEHGHCWSLTPEPDITGSKTSLGTKSSAGTFSSILQNLEPGKSYYVRAYAVCGGMIANDWGFAITARGVCWNKSGMPSLENCTGYTDDGSGTGIYTSNLTGLTKDTTYYVRAYATNSIGTGYEEERVFEITGPFECGTSAISDYDGNEYNTIQIGSQCWMKENLKTTHYADGTSIPLIEGTSAWNAKGYTDKAYCYYDNSTSDRDVYGALYTWAAAMRIPAGCREHVLPDGTCRAMQSGKSWKYSWV